MAKRSRHAVSAGLEARSERPDDAVRAAPAQQAGADAGGYRVVSGTAVSGAAASRMRASEATRYGRLYSGM